MSYSRLFGNVLRGLLVGLPITVTFCDCVGYVAKVEGISMQPTLNPKSNLEGNDYVLLNRWSTRHFQIRRGDVVSLFCPRNPEQKIIKRVIGVHGDTVKTLSHKDDVILIPEGHCWIEGDHRDRSMDSNNFGPVSLGLITAKASHIVWPPKRWQKIRRFIPESRQPIVSNSECSLRNNQQHFYGRST